MLAVFIITWGWAFNAKSSNASTRLTLSLFLTLFVQIGETRQCGQPSTLLVKRLI